MAKYQNLEELTGQESGAVMVLRNDSTGEMLILNWKFRQINGVPRIAPMGVGCVGLGETLTVEKKERIENFGQYVEEIRDTVKTIWDESDNKDEILTEAGYVYLVRTEHGEEITVFAPDGWN